MTRPVAYEPLSSPTLIDPYGVYAALRANAPVYWHEQMQCWVLTRYDDCREILQNHDVFARDWRRVGDSIPDEKLTVQSLDPPEVAPLRRIFVNSVKAQDLKGASFRGGTMIRDAFDRLAGRSDFDLMSEVAAPVAEYLTCELFGVEPPAAGSFDAIAYGIALAMDSGLVPEQSERGTAAAAQLMESVDAWFEAPGASGIVPTLARSPEFIRAPDTLVRRTLGAMCNAAYSTIYASIGNATLALLEHPEALRRLKEDNELAVTGADELIRFDGPAQGTSRVATVETTIDDTTIERGHVVLTLFGAANRDPAQFASPNELVLDRSPNRHLGFGWGAHACFGAEPARHALREYVARLAAFPRTLELAGEPRRRPTATLRWLQMLPVAFH